MRIIKPQENINQCLVFFYYRGMIQRLIPQFTPIMLKLQKSI